MRNGPFWRTGLAEWWGLWVAAVLHTSVCVQGVAFHLSRSVLLLSLQMRTQLTRSPAQASNVKKTLQINKKREATR